MRRQLPIIIVLVILLSSLVFAGNVDLFKVYTDPLGSVTIVHKYAEDKVAALEAITKVQAFMVSLGYNEHWVIAQKIHIRFADKVTVTVPVPEKKMEAVIEVYAIHENLPDKIIIMSLGAAQRRGMAGSFGLTPVYNTHVAIISHELMHQYHRAAFKKDVARNAKVTPTRAALEYASYVMQFMALDKENYDKVLDKHPDLNTFDNVSEINTENYQQDEGLFAVKSAIHYVTEGDETLKKFLKGEAGVESIDKNEKWEPSDLREELDKRDKAGKKQSVDDVLKKIKILGLGAI